MSKYIIKNCPCFNEGHPMLDYFGECLDLTSDTQVCQDCTDCVLKQIVEYCKNIEKDHYWGMREMRFSQEILKLLDIQEVE